MSEEKRLKARVIHKHKTEAEWRLDVYDEQGNKRADAFIPKKGELIIFDPEVEGNPTRFKFGDEVNDVIALPFEVEKDLFITEENVGQKVIPVNSDTWIRLNFPSDKTHVVEIEVIDEYGEENQYHPSCNSGTWYCTKDWAPNCSTLYVSWLMDEETSEYLDHTVDVKYPKFALTNEVYTKTEADKKHQELSATDEILRSEIEKANSPYGEALIETKILPEDGEDDLLGAYVYTGLDYNKTYIIFGNEELTLGGGVSLNFVGKKGTETCGANINVEPNTIFEPSKLVWRLESNGQPTVGPIEILYAYEWSCYTEGICEVVKKYYSPDQVDSLLESVKSEITSEAESKHVQIVTEVKSYTDGHLELVRTDMINQDVAVLHDAQAYTDALVASSKEELDELFNIIASGDGENSIQQNGTNAISKHSVAFGSGTYAGGMGYKVIGIVLDNGIIITQETENPKKIQGTVVGYKLRTVEGLETEMNYSVRLGLAKYHCGTIASIDTTTQQILVNNAPQIKYLNTKQDDPDNDFIGNVLTITGRPELGDVNIGFNAISFGKDNASMERNTFTAGVDNSAIGSAGAAFGNGNIAGYEAFATGRNNKALGDQSSAFGGHNEVYGAFSQVHGDSNVVYSLYASAEGRLNTMNANCGHVEGYSNIVDEAAIGTHVEGSNNTTVVGQYSHVEGSHNEVLVGSVCSHVEGDYNTIGSEDGTRVVFSAHAEGRGTVASASYAHAEGFYTESTNQCAHSEGDHAVAEGYASHAGGSYTTASRLNSFAHGNYVNATEENSVAFGQHNIPEGRLLSVGDGTEKVPSNAFEVFADGRVGAKTPAKELTDLVQLKQAIVLSRRAVESEEIDPTVMQFKENKNNPFELSVVAASKPKTPLTELHIPAIYNNKVVTSVGESAFKNIKDEGYPYNGLTTLTVAYGVEKIEGYAFEGCKALTHIDLPTTITEIGPMAFKQAGIKTLVLPPHIKLISGQAFRGTPIENIVRIPSTCVSIGYASKDTHCGKVFGSKVPAVIFEGVPEQIHENTFLDSACDIYVPWSKGEVPNAPWGTTTEKIHYNYRYTTMDEVQTMIAEAIGSAIGGSY